MKNPSDSILVKKAAVYKAYVDQERVEEISLLSRMAIAQIWEDGGAKAIDACFSVDHLTREMYGLDATYSPYIMAILCTEVVNSGLKLMGDAFDGE